VSGGTPSARSATSPRAAAQKGLGGIMLFGVPDDAGKDPRGTQAWAADGILQRGIAACREAVGDDLVIMSDVCLDEFTSHGHCGFLTEDGWVLNDQTCEAYAQQAVAQARAGSHVVAPSGMMDGQVQVIRAGLDAAGFEEVAILAYSAKYASAFYGPFREAVGSSLQGDRRTYQQDPANRREGLKEALLDLAEGADMVMIKPAKPLPRRALRRGGHLESAGGGLPGLGGIRHDRGGGGTRLDRPACCH